MAARDPREKGRVATPLELLFDLTFAAALSVAADLLAEFIAAGHVGLGILGFSFTMFAILVGRINFSWFALALTPLHLEATFVLIAVLGAVELLVPVFAQGRANGTPWHPHHIAERYSAFAIHGRSDCWWRLSCFSPARLWSVPRD